MSLFKNQSALIMTVILSLSQVTSVLFAQINEPWKASKETIAELSKSPDAANFNEEKIRAYTLPGVMTSNNGTTITTFQTWNKVNRPEILELFKKNVYGRIPVTPYKESFQVVYEDKTALKSNATLKQVDITISA